MSQKNVIQLPVEEYENLLTMAKLMSQLQAKVERLEASAVASPILPTPVREPRMSDPDFFNGSRSETKNYLTQVRMVISANPSCFPSEKAKILYACSYLRGPAFSWAQPLLQTENSPALSSFESFARSLISQFGDKDELLTAERDIYLLKQNSSVSLYATEFTKLSGFLQWNDAALCAQFYRNLKSKIKDELSTMEKPSDLKKLIDICIRIDHRLYERHLERKLEFPSQNYVNYSPSHDSRTRSQNSSSEIRSSFHASNRNGHVPIVDTRTTPMEIDSISVKTFRGKLTPEELSRRHRLNLCAYCGDSSHLVENCPIKPKNSNSNLKEKARRI